MKKEKLIDVYIVRGAEGFSLHVGNKDGGYRVAGPKAWGNPFNKPTAEFNRVNVEELIKHIKENQYEE